MSWMLIAAAIVAAAFLVRFLSEPQRRSSEPEEARHREPESLEEEEPDFPSEPIELPLEDSIDLHAFAPKDIPDVVESYLEGAAEKGFGEVRLIHGRGIGVQRARVQSLLAKHPLVVSYRDAPGERGGWGATIAWLKTGDDQGRAD